MARDLENPFEEIIVEWTHDHEKAIGSALSEPMNARTKEKALDAGAMILRLAEIDDELSRRGIDPLVDEKDELRERLKALMLAEGVAEVFEETSGWEAIIQQRSTETWHPEVLKEVLAPSQCKRYIVVREDVDVGAVLEGIKNGDLSRAEMEYRGAVMKVPGAKALYVRQRKEKQR